MPKLKVYVRKSHNRPKVRCARMSFLKSKSTSVLVRSSDGNLVWRKYMKPEISVHLHGIMGYVDQIDSFLAQWTWYQAIVDVKVVGYEVLYILTVTLCRQITNASKSIHRIDGEGRLPSTCALIRYAVLSSDMQQADFLGCYIRATGTRGSPDGLHVPENSGTYVEYRMLNRMGTPRRSGPCICWSFKDTPSYFADESITPRIWSSLCGW